MVDLGAHPGRRRGRCRDGAYALAGPRRHGTVAGLLRLSCPVRRDDDALTFRRSVLDLPLPEHTPELAEMFGSYAAALVRRLKPESSFVDRVREALVEGLLSDAANEAAVADGSASRSARYTGGWPNWKALSASCEASCSAAAPNNC